MKPFQNNRTRSQPTPVGREQCQLARTYESNRPDFKIRGSARDLLERYLQLARDAHAANDRVAAENYLQHAEHYFRLIAAAQSQAQNGNARPLGTSDSEELDRLDAGRRYIDARHT